jgi:WXXGXW repeat (2 copies)
LNRQRRLDVKRLLGAFVITSSLLAAGACATSGRVYVRVGPPPPHVEAVVVAPGPGFVWIPGYYRWDGSVYVWVPGHYERRPRPRAVWVPAHWEHRRRGWYFVPGRWR